MGRAFEEFSHQVQINYDDMVYTGNRWSNALYDRWYIGLSTNIVAQYGLIPETEALLAETSVFNLGQAPSGSETEQDSIFDSDTTNFEEKVPDLIEQAPLNISRAVIEQPLSENSRRKEESEQKKADTELKERGLKPKLARAGTLDNLRRREAVFLSKKKGEKE